MQKALTVAAAGALVFHGMIHLLGTIAYMRLGHFDGLAHQTTLLGGTWEVGDAGMRLYGALWAVAAVGFLGATAAWIAGLAAWRPLLVGVTLFSMALTALDYRVAAAGIAVNAAILAALWLVPRVLPNATAWRPEPWGEGVAGGAAGGE